MEAAGINPAELDTVAITHAHPDHVGGTLDDQGRPVYADAHYYIWKDEWEFWFSELAEAKTFERFVTCARTNLKPLQDQVTLLDRESEIVPGVRAVPAPGHMVVEVRSAGQLLLYIGDTVLYPLHLEHPNWLPIYDIVPEQAAPSKQAIFDRAAEERAWVIGQHFPPFPSLGHVVKEGEGWRWRPIETIG
jgi:glyoxylase-like metal-dependent hydrolase (beta-lactamase superfamily II)